MIATLSALAPWIAASLLGGLLLAALLVGGEFAVRMWRETKDEDAKNA